MPEHTLENLRIARGWTKKQMHKHLTQLAKDIEDGKHDRLIDYTELSIDEEQKQIN